MWPNELVPGTVFGKASLEHCEDMNAATRNRYFRAQGWRNFETVNHTSGCRPFVVEEDRRLNMGPNQGGCLVVASRGRRSLIYRCILFQYQDDFGRTDR